MLYAARKYQKSASYVLGALLILGIGFSTMAQFSDNAYVVRTVHIFPSEVSSNGWQNAETLNFQNLDEYALLQDFNTINSATLSKSLQVVPTTNDEGEEDIASGGPDPVTNESQSAADEQVVAESDQATTTQDDIGDEQSVIEQPVTLPATNTVQTTTAPEPESDSPTTTEEAGTQLPTVSGGSEEA